MHTYKQGAIHFFSCKYFVASFCVRKEYKWLIPVLRNYVKCSILTFALVAQNFQPLTSLTALAVNTLASYATFAHHENTKNTSYHPKPLTLYASVTPELFWGPTNKEIDLEATITFDHPCLEFNECLVDEVDNPFQDD